MPTAGPSGGALADGVRRDFPLLSSEGPRGLVYLDTAATSQKPASVLEAMRHYYHNDCANIHKGVEHRLSSQATDAYEGARQKVAKFVNASRPEEIVFTRNATEGINIVAHGWGRHNLKEGDEIRMSVAEHHSMLAPWQMVAEQTGARIVDVDLTEDEEIDLEDLQRKLSSKTKVLGCVLPARRVCEMAHAQGALVLLDSCQYVPHRTTDVQALGCDWLVASGHKMLAPTASGFLWGRYEILSEMEPLMVGGSTTGKIHYGRHSDAKPPMRFEAGTPAIAESIGLGAAIDYLTAVGMDNIQEYEEQLARQLYSELSQVPGLRILGPRPGAEMGRASLCSFLIDGVDIRKLDEALNEQGFCVSAGHHRATPLHEDYLKIGKTMRASAYVYNTPGEVSRFAAAVKDGAAELKQGAAGRVASAARQGAAAVKEAVTAEG